MFVGECRALHVSGTEDLLLYLASSDEERQFAFHVLEIISLMFREQVTIRLFIYILHVCIRSTTAVTTISK